MKRLINQNPFLLALVLLFSFNFGLTIFRIAYTGGGYFLFLIWNLFLAFIPFVFIQMALWFEKHKLPNLGILGIAALSLLFLPNSPYIMTDLFHLKYWKHSAPLWFDTMMIFSYAATGIVLFYATLLGMEKLLKKYLPASIVGFSMLIIIFLNAFGIYLGRYMRFNSWDIISNPMGLIGEILERFVDPISHTRTWGMTLSYGILFLIGFLCIKLFQRSIEIQNEQLLQENNG